MGPSRGHAGAQGMKKIMTCCVVLMGCLGGMACLFAQEETRIEEDVGHYETQYYDPNQELRLAPEGDKVQSPSKDYHRKVKQSLFPPDRFQAGRGRKDPYIEHYNLKPIVPIPKTKN